ncbi:MAG: hypothetical protein RJB66_2226 [Pseudomonadota bacterium]|jgi:hypothetical protein
MIRNTLQKLVITLVVAVLFGACSNNRGRGTNTGANIGVLPTNTCLLSPNGHQGLCNYNYGGYQGFANYDYTLYMNGLNNNYANGFCGCGQGGYPVYNNNWGLGCVNGSYIQNGYGNYGNRFLMFSWNSSALQWASSATSYYNNYGGYNSCPRTIILTCDTGVQGSCGPNGVCMSMNPYGGSGYSQSGPGICIMNQNAYTY